MSYREVSSPLTDDMLRPLEPGCDRVQFRSLLTDEDFARLANFLRGYPHVVLRAFGHGIGEDLEFLRFFPDIHRFCVDAHFHLQNIDGLRHLSPKTVSLELGLTKRTLSLAPLARFDALRRLRLEGHTKDLSVVGELRRLRSLTLRSITLPDLTPFAALSELRALDLKLGGTNNLDGITAFPDLRYLEIWKVRGFHDLSAITAAPTLEYLFLQSMGNLGTIPLLSDMTRLKRVHLQAMRGLTDLTPLLTAPALEEVVLYEMGHLQPAQVGVLAKSGTLRRAVAALESPTKNAAAAALLNLPEPTPADEYLDRLLALDQEP